MGGILKATIYVVSLPFCVLAGMVWAGLSLGRALFSRTPAQPVFTIRERRIWDRSWSIEERLELQAAGMTEEQIEAELKAKPYPVRERIIWYRTRFSHAEAVQDMMRCPARQQVMAKAPIRRRRG